MAFLLSNIAAKAAEERKKKQAQPTDGSFFLTNAASEAAAKRPAREPEPAPAQAAGPAQNTQSQRRAAFMPANGGARNTAQQTENTTYTGTWAERQLKSQAAQEKEEKTQLDKRRAALTGSHNMEWQPAEPEQKQKPDVIPGTNIPTDSVRGRELAPIVEQMRIAQLIPGYQEYIRKNTEYLKWMDSFEDDDAYAAYLEQAKRDKEHDLTMSSFDVSEAQRQLELMYQHRAELEGQGSDNAYVNDQLALVNAQIKDLEGNIAEWGKYKKYAEYSALTNAEDFEANSAYRSQYDKDADQYTYIPGLYADSQINPDYGYDYGLPILDAGSWVNTGDEVDELYELVNGNESVWAMHTQNAAASAGSGGAFIYGVEIDPMQVVRQMNDEEKSIFNYLYATRGKDKAHEYFGFIQDDLNRRNRLAEQQRATEISENNPLLGSLMAIAYGPTKMTSFVGQGVMLAATGEIDENAPYNKFSYIPQAAQGAAEKEVEKIWGKPGTRAYEIGMSIANNMYNMLVSGGVGEAGVLSEGMVLALMGSAAAADNVLAAKDRGLNDAQAYTFGAVTGIIEIITEKIGLDELYASAFRGENVLKELVRNVMAESTEEVAAEVLDDVVDVIIAGLDSERMKRVQELIGQGYTTGQAFGKAYGELGLDMLEAGFAGAVSGGFFAGGATVVNAIQDDVQQYKFEQAYGDAINRISGQNAATATPTPTTVEEYQRIFEEAAAQNDTVAPAAAEGTSAPVQETTDTTEAENAAQPVLEPQTEPAAPTVTPELQREAMSGLQSLASTLGENGREAMTSAYDPQGQASISDYEQQFMELYNAAREGRALPEQTPALTPAQQREAYVAGIKDRTGPLQNAAPESTIRTEVTPAKQAQYEALQAADVQTDDFEPITAPEQIMTYQEALQAARDGNQKLMADYDMQDAAEALESGEVTVYSAGPVRTGSFVTPSRMIAESMAEGRRISSMTVPLDSVAWTDATGGQFVETEDINNGTRGDILPRSGERSDGQSAGEQTRQLEGRTGQDQSGNEGRQNAAARSENVRGAESSDRGQVKSTAELGVPDGSTEDTGLSLVEDDSSEEIKKVKALAKEMGLELVLFKGGNLHVRGVEARACIIGNKVWVRADHSFYTAEQLLRHENGHRLIDSGEIDPDTVRERIGQASADAVARIYALAYKGSMTAEEAWIEIICDAQGDMNIFAEAGNSNAPTYQRFLDVVKPASENSARTERGPPRGETQFSRSRRKDYVFRDHGYKQSDIEFVEWKMRQEAQTTDQYLDEETKWLYTKSKGEQFFAVYGISDEAGPTPLYASIGGNADIDYRAFTENEEEFKNGNLRNWSDINRSFKAYRNKARLAGRSVSNAKDGRSESGNVRISSGTQDRNGGPDTRGSAENSGGVTQFSMQLPVEETDRLIAWHNMNAGALESALELGGLAMPSFAVKPADNGHYSYGPISIIASKDSVAPGRNQSIYGGDAWTPTFPGVEYKVTYESAEKLENEIKSLVGEETYKQFGGATLDSDNISSALGRSGGTLPGHYRNSLLLKYAYLKSIGKDITLPQTGEALDGFGYFSNDEVQQFVNKLTDGRASLNRLRNMSADELMQQKDLKTAMTQIREEYYKEKLGNDKAFEKLKAGGFFSEGFTFSRVDAMLTAAEEYYRNNGIKQTIDKRTAEEIIDKEINKDDFEKWALDKLNSTVVKKGIRNEKDTFTPSGNRRSFDQLHYDYTLANIVKAMRAQPKQGRTQFLSGPGSTKGAALKSYRNIEEVRSDIDRIIPEDSEEAKAAYDHFGDSVKETSKYISPDDWLNGSDMIADILNNAKTRESILRYLRSEYGFLESQDHLDLNRIADEVLAIAKEANTLPMEYFEAKLYRAFPISEAAGVVVPSDLSQDLIDKLKEQGATVLTYEAGNDEDRLAKVNSIEGARFSSALSPEALEQQNEQLRKDLQAATAALAKAQKQAAYWEGQTKPSPAPSPDATDINRFARYLVSTNATNLKAKDIAPALTELSEYIMRGGNERDELTFSGVKERAVGIAHDILQNYSELLESTAISDYKEIRKRIRDYGTIQVPGNDLPPDWADWKARHRWLRVAVSTGAPLDLVYKDLSTSYPWFFPSDANPGSDQLYALVDGVLNAEPAYWNPNDEVMAEASEYLANQIIDGLVNGYVDELGKTVEMPIRQAKTYADRMQKKLFDQRYGAQQKLDAQKAIMQEAVRQARERSDQRLANLKAHYAEVQQNARERKMESNMRTRLLKIAKRLQDKKLPTPSRALVNEYVGYIDTVAKNMTGKTRDKLQALSELYNYELENNPDFTRDEAIEKKLSRLNAVRISDLTIEQVQDLIDVLLGLEHQLNTAKRELDSADRRDVYQKGVQIIGDVKGGHTVKPQYMETLDNLFVRNTLSPLRELRRQTGYVDGDPLYEAGLRLNRGQLRMNDYVMKNSKTFDEWVQDKEFMESLTGKKAKTIKVRGTGMDGQPVTVEITPDMRISLYLHNRNLQNQQHISSMSGGVKVPDMKLYRAGKISEAYAKGTRIRLQPSEIRAICENMTAKERALAERIYKYFNTTSRNALSDEFERLKGYMMRFVEDYFPIDTDGSFTKANAEAINFDGSLEGSGWLKERVVNAKNPIMLYDATSVLLKAIQAHGQFVGLAVPIRDFTKLYGMNGPVYDEAKNRIGSQSVKETIKQTWGTGATDYIDKMLGDLQKTHTESNSWTDLFRQIRSNYAGATLALNLSVALKQAGSYPTAAAVLGWRPLARAMADFGKVDLDYIASLTPLQWLRSQGYSTPELGDLKAKGRQLPPALNWIQGMDLLTTRKLWKACEYYMQENHPDLKRGSDQYNGTISELYNRVIEETQPNYTVMQRPQLLRSNNELLRDVSMFKTQLFQNFNIFYDAFGNMAAKHQQYQANPNGETKAKYEEAKKNASRASSALIVQSVVIAAMTLAWNALRGKLKRYKDEEKDKITGWSFAKRFGLDVASGFFSMVPFGSEIFSMISSKLTGDKWYGFEGVTTGALTDFFSTIMTAADQIGKSLEAAKGSNTAAIQKQVLAWEDIAENTAKVFGVPAENVMNLIKAVYGSITKTACGKYYGEYLSMLATTPIEGNKGQYYDLLYKAQQENPEAFWEIYNSLIEIDAMASDKKSTAENIDAALKQRAKKAG